LALNGVISNANRCSVIAVNMRFWLWVPKFFKGESINHSLLAIQEEGTKFGFGG
jgi:hypothetical protein